MVWQVPLWLVRMLAHGLIPITKHAFSSEVLGCPSSTIILENFPLVDHSHEAAKVSDGLKSLHSTDNWGILRISTDAILSITCPRSLTELWPNIHFSEFSVSCISSWAPFTLLVPPSTTLCTFCRLCLPLSYTAKCSSSSPPVLLWSHLPLPSWFDFSLGVTLFYLSLQLLPVLFHGFLCDYRLLHLLQGDTCIKLQFLSKSLVTDVNHNSLS